MAQEPETNLEADLTDTNAEEVDTAEIEDTDIADAPAEEPEAEVSISDEEPEDEADDYEEPAEAEEEQSEDSASEEPAEAEETGEAVENQIDSDEDVTTVIAPFDENAIESSGTENTELAEATAEDEEPKKSGKGKKAALIACGSIVGVAAVAYLGGALFFSSHFYPNSTFNGEDVSMMSTAEVAAAADEQTKGYAPTVSGMGVDYSIDLDHIDFKFNSKAYVDSAKAQESCFTWPVELNKSHELTADNPVSYDEKTLITAVRSEVSKINANGTEPENATIEYSKKTKQFAAKAGNPGTLLDVQSVLSSIEQGLANLEPTIQLTEENLKQPKVTVESPELLAAVDEANGYLSAIDFKSEDKEIYTLDGKILSNWVSISKDLKVSFNEESARMWLDNTLRSNLDSKGSERKYKNEQGKTVKVSGGSYGWSFDLEGVTDKVIKLINKKKGGTVELKATSKADTWNPGGRDWTGPYVDVDLADQYARYYDKNGKILWESDIVSGNTSSGHGTPSGVWVLNSKGTNVTLVGSDANGDGKPDYETPVTYWMPFIDNSIGLHDASWRGSFGGGIYSYNGSHGCINLPYSNAAALYPIIEVGTVVVTHW